jgi:hypothetical protein
MKWRLAAALVCFALAAVAVLLARDAWHWRKALRDGDARAETVATGARSWRADETLPFGVARRLLGIDDDLAYRALITRAIKLAGEPADSPEDARARAPVETALARLESSPDRWRASRAAAALGILLYTDPEDRTSAESPADKALERFQLAVRLDPRNDEAKQNLELLLQQARTENPRGRSQAGGGNEAGAGQAGLAPPGSGY